MATKVSYKVVIKTIGGTSVEANDATVAGQGSAAYARIHQGNSVIVKSSTGETIIPYHAIDNAVVTITSSTVDDPTDDNCNETNETTGD